MNSLETFPDTIRCVDASWHLGNNRDAHKEFLEGHVPGATFFDIDDIADKTLPLPHMLPSEEVFSRRVSSMGINNDHTVVIYNTAGSFSAPRCWWTFRCFNHKKVHVLDGGLPAWVAEGGMLEVGEEKAVSTRPSAGLVQASGNAWKLKEKGFKSRLNPAMLRSWRQVLEQSTGEGGKGQIVDARSLGRFLAQVPEPRKGLAGGHIPSSLCVPFNHVLEEGNLAKFRTATEIRQVFEEAGVDVDSSLPLIATCGSGVTAAVLALALEVAGRDAERSPVYDGSWTEWGSRDDLPKVGS
ncbi:unnamed protein product [Choristocarpus tenellus]